MKKTTEKLKQIKKDTHTVRVVAQAAKKKPSKEKKKSSVSKTHDRGGALIQARDALREAGGAVVSRGGALPRDLSKQLAPLMESIFLPRKVVMQIADEVVDRLKRRRTERKATRAKIENPIFLDTSAIIDERLFELVKLEVFFGNFVVIEGVLSELKHIADLKDDVKRERGRRALKMLDEMKKQKNVKLIILKNGAKSDVVDDKVIDSARAYKGRIITCDFNLSRKAKVSGVVAIDIHEVANALKTQAIPGESFFVKIIQEGKGHAQGVGYLPDGTMIVVENGVEQIGKTVRVIVSRIIQTEAGKILFSKISSE